jgi:predicted nucleic-acid-binding protein
MENRGLLFIPDISGFTKFINETEIDHSRLIIQELLELLINANHVGLEVSEIEGDAILFYKFGEAPALDELYRQVEKMFCDFHRSLMAYEYRRFCNCKACTSAIGLTLKIITHYGEFTGYNVKKFQKLIGKDIIVAHQLLKNDIEQHEYWLITDNLLQSDPPGFAEWMQWNSSIKKTDNGEIAFRYTQLSPLKNAVKPGPVPQLELRKKKKMFSVSKEYGAGIIQLFHAAGDFSYRRWWQEGVKAVEEVNHFLPRLGMRCRCVLENGESYIYASSYSFGAERIEFSETDEGDNSTRYYTLEQVNKSTTRLTLDYYLPKNILGEFLFKLNKKKKLEQELQKSLLNLESVVKDVKLPEPVMNK